MNKPEQPKKFSDLNSGKFNTRLLQGVTGSERQSLLPGHGKSTG